MGLDSAAPPSGRQYSKSGIKLAKIALVLLPIQFTLLVKQPAPSLDYTDPLKMRFAFVALALACLAAATPARRTNVSQCNTGTPTCCESRVPGLEVFGLS